MGEYITRDKTGAPLVFSIKNDTPSQTEMARINDYMTNGPQTEAPPVQQQQQEPGIVSSFGSGLARGWNEIQAGVDTAGQSLFEALGDPERAKEWQKSAEAQRAERDSYYAPSGGFFDPGTSKLNMVASTMGQSAPSMIAGYGGMGAGGVAGGYIGGAIGSLLDPFVGPLGTVAGAAAGSLIGGEVGGALGYSPQMLNSNAERQIEQFGYVKDWGKAYAATGLQAGIETATDKIGLHIIAGLGKAGSVIGKTFLNPATETAVKEGADIGFKKALTIVAKKVGEETAFKMVSGATEEALQQGLERWQADLPLMDDQAKKEYIENAVMGGIVESIFGAGEGVVGGRKEVHDLRSEHEAKKDAEAEAASTSAKALQYAPQYEQKRKAGYNTPSSTTPTEENPTVIAMPDQSGLQMPDKSGTPPNDFVENEHQLPPGLRDDAMEEFQAKVKAETVAPTEARRQQEAKTYKLPEEEDVAASQVTPPGTTASVPFMITAAMRQDLRNLGYSTLDIKNMKPAEAHDILFKGAPKPPPSAPSSPYAVGNVVGPDGMRLVHGSGDATLTADSVAANKNTGKGKKGSILGGLFAHAEEDLTHAENQSKAQGGTPTVYNVDIAPGTKIYRHDGDITQLLKTRSKQLAEQGIGVVAGKDANGRTQYAVLNHAAIKDMSPRIAEAASPTTHPGPEPTVNPNPDLVPPNQTSETSTPVIGSDTPIGPPTRPFSETQYQNAVNTLRDGGVLSTDKISKMLNVSKAEAQMYLQEILQRGDAHPAGDKGQYGKIISPRDAPGKQTGRPTTRRSREYVVKPVVSEDARPHYVEVNGQKVGDRFSTTEQAQAWINQNVPEGEKGNATIGQDDAGTSYSINEVQHEHVPGKEPRQISDNPIQSYQTKAEADEAVKDYDPAYSPKTNHWKNRQATEERQARVQADFEKEAGPIAAKLAPYMEKVLGKGKADLGILPRLTNPNAPDAVVEGTSQDVLRTNPDGMKRVIGNLIKLAHDLYNPKLSVEERARLMQGVLNHELIHALRSLDLLTPKEWNMLYQHALEQKVPGKSYTWMQLAAARTHGLPPHILAEEGIAEMARHYMNDPTAFRNPHRSLIQKIAQFIKKMMRLGQRHDAADLMDTIFSGGIADREIGHGGLGPRPRNQDDVRYSLTKPDNFYLKSARFMEGVTREEAPKNDWIKMLSSAGIKDEELKWLGIKDWLQNLPKGELVHRNDIFNYIKASGPKVETVIWARGTHPDLADAAIARPRWAQRTQSSEHDNTYAEVAFTFPEIKGEPTYYDPGGHMKVPDNQPKGDVRKPRALSDKKLGNVLAFARFRDIHENGKKVLFIEEIQSDLHQQGSMKGYYSGSAAVRLNDLEDQARDNYNNAKEIRNQKIKVDDDLFGLKQQERTIMEETRGTYVNQALLDNRRQQRALYQQSIDLQTQTNNLSEQRRALMAEINGVRDRMTIPNAPFKSNWEDYVIRRMIRHAAEHGYDGIAWHGSAESVAETEGYGELEQTTDEKGRTNYTAYGGQAKVGPIVNRYLTKLPRITKALVEPFGVNLDHEVGQGRTAPGPEEWGQHDRPGLMAMSDDINAFLPDKSTLRQVTGRINDAHRNLESNDGYDTEDDRIRADNLTYSLRLATQMANNRRRFDPVEILEDANFTPEDVRHLIGWDTSRDFYEGLRQAQQQDTGGTPQHDRYQVMFNSAMTHSFETGDQPFFSMVKQRKDQIVADPKFRKWFGESVIKEDDGSPMVLYHGTRAPEKFGAFNQISHFGTIKAANDRLDQERGFDTIDDDTGWENHPALRGLDPDNMSDEEIDQLLQQYEYQNTGTAPVDEHERIYPVFLNLKRPLRIKDNGLTHAEDYAEAAHAAGAITDKQYNNILNMLWGDSQMNQLVRLLKKQGYDGFQYENAQEDPGSTSYAIFNANQAKSIFNRGEWSKDPDILYSQMRNAERADDERGWKTGARDVLYSMTRDRKDKIVNTPNFMRWWKKGTITDTDGSPKIVYHSTKADTIFSRFYRMTHWGTSLAANDRLQDGLPHFVNGEMVMDAMGIHDDYAQQMYWSKLTNDERDELFKQFHEKRQNDMLSKPIRIYPAFINLQNPLHIWDTGSQHSAFEYITAAHSEGALDNHEATMLRGLTHALGDTFGTGQFIKMMQKKGIDGLSYENQVEDPGSTSYVTFQPNQIKSVFNSGTWSNDPDIYYSQLQDRGAELKQENDNFKHWFGNSRVVDEDSNPMLMFHGTGQDFNIFDDARLGEATGHPTAKLGFFFSADPAIASDFAGLQFTPNADDKRYDTGAHVIPSYLSIQHPYVMSASEFAGMVARESYHVNNGRMAERHDLVAGIRRNMMKAGYDGIRIVGDEEVGKREYGEEYASDAWVAFHPNQIKSALSKEYSTENDSFKYSMVHPQYSATAPTGQRVPAVAPIDQLSEVHNKITYDNLSPVLHKLIDWTVPGSIRKAKWKAGADDTIISLQDRMMPIGRLIDRMKKNGGFISNENDVYLRETLYSGQTDAHLTANDRDLYKPMLNSIQNLSVTKDDYNEARNISPRVAEFLDGYQVNPKHALSELYLYARHAQERNAVMRRRNERIAGERPMQYEAGSGMGDGEAQAVLDWFDSKPFGREFSDLNNPNSIRSRMREIVKSTNDVRVNAGLNPDFRTMLHPDGTPVENYQDYVPIRGFLGEASLRDEDMSDFAKTGKGFNIRGKEDYSALGRESMGRDLIAHAIMQNQESIVRAGKNKVTQSFRQLILDNPAQMADVAELVQMPRTKYTYDRTAGVVRQVVDNSVQTDPTILKGKVDGQQFYIKMKDPRIVRAMGSKSGLGSNTGLQSLILGLTKVNRFLAATRTSYNPEFMIANMLRDLQTALINVSEVDKKGIHRQIVASVFPALNGVRKALRSGDHTSEWAKIHEEFRRHGGHTAVFGIRELADTIDKMNAHFSEDVSGGISKVKQPIAWLGKFVSDYNEAIENGTRLAAYKTLRDKYLEMSGDPHDPDNQLRAKEMAAFAAKNLTINFNMGGESKGVMSALYMFFNASMQGSMAMINPFIRSKKMKAVWASVLVAGALQDLLMSLFSPTDDDGRKQYDKIPDFVLEHNMVFMDPFGISKRGYFKLPMPYLMNGIYNWGRAAARTARGKYSFGQLMSTGGMTMLDSLNPWGGSNSFLNFVAPTLIDPFVDLYMNEDFTGKPVAPPVGPFDNTSENRSQQYWNNTNPAFVSIAHWMSRLTGSQGDYIPGKMEYSPNQVEYVADWLTGGTGTMLARAGHLMYAGATGDFSNIDAGVIPFARKAYGSITEKNDLQSYIQGRDQVLRIRKALQDARKDGDNETYMKIMREYPDEYKIAAKVNALENARKKLGSRIKRLKDNERIPQGTKDEMIKRMKDRQNELVGRGNEVMTAID